MSYDFALQKLCSHEVAMESAAIDPISKSFVSFKRNPTNSRVQLYVDGILVPQTGLYSISSLPFMKSEPYRIVSGVSDLIYIKIGNGAPQIIQIIPGLVKASDIAADLARKIPSIDWTVENKRVVASASPSRVQTSFSFPDPRWTDRTQSLPTTSRILGAYQQLGILPGRCVANKKLYPGWRIRPDSTSPDETGLSIQFESPLFNSNPLIQLSYVTSAVDCRRCHGTQIEYDYSILNNTYETVKDVDLLGQEFDKFLFTKIGSHFKWNWLGSGLMDRIGSKGSTAGVSINSLITMDIAQAFKLYQNIKSQQDSRFAFQNVSDAEYPLSLGGINIQVPDQDPTIAIVTTTIVSRSLVPVELKRLVGNPNPFFLSGNPTAFLQR
jgi:hypothetical protein